ncbi:MAG TPA: hypothetical protein VMW07_04330 [Gallionella sp.]|nr:hypothetical protein [Gallionella sp.]
MIFEDFHFYLVLATPYSVLTFALIWLSLRWQCDWTLDIGTVKLVGSVFASILGTTTLVFFMNFVILMSFPDSLWNHEILPNSTIGVMVYTTFAFTVSFVVGSLMKSKTKLISSTAIE